MVHKSRWRSIRGCVRGWVDVGCWHSSRLIGTHALESDFRRSRDSFRSFVARAIIRILFILFNFKHSGRDDQSPWMLLLSSLMMLTSLTIPSSCSFLFENRQVQLWNWRADFCALWILFVGRCVVRVILRLSVVERYIGV